MELAAWVSNLPEKASEEITRRVLGQMDGSGRLPEAGVPEREVPRSSRRGTSRRVSSEVESALRA